MQPKEHLGDSRRIMYEEMQQNPGIRYERNGRRLNELAHEYKYDVPTLGVALWELEKKGLVSKERKGRNVYYYYGPEEKVSGRKALPNPTTKSSPVIYTVTYERDEDGYVVASVPALPGCHTQGKTKDEARRNIEEAMRGYVASLKHRGLPLPEEESEQIRVAL